MRNLLAYLYRIRILILFVFLEAIAFTWISASRSYQRSVFINSANSVTGGMLQRTNDVEEYLDLVDQNEKLAEENAKLRNQSEGSFFPLSTDTTTVIDSSNAIRYTYIDAEIVSGSYRKARNYMTINRGSVHGVEKGMGVIGSKGIVGVIKDVSKHFSTVIPLINPSFSVSGRIKNSGYFGPVLWNNNDYQYAYLTDIPRYAKITKGDTIVTDSRSLLFPMGLTIGYIDSYNLQEDQNFFAVKINLATDFASIHHVYVIEDKMKLEVQNLQSQQDPK
ncbi:rod shape-determining protein MreC [Owenweeksia hongkongensis]|uniref:rod shape-determining protein MreC n=1 Tax=Owenweeksia hongkongensis TaxID=253245 RepID=UPI003A9238A4